MRPLEGGESNLTFAVERCDVAGQVLVVECAFALSAAAAHAHERTRVGVVASNGHGNDVRVRSVEL
jgi:hypothetical protein